MGIEKPLFRQVMGSFAAGVTVVTTRGADGTPYGLTATAFSSVSLLPPLALVCVDKKSESYSYFEPAGIFGVSFLERAQESISQLFATTGGDKFADLAWHSGSLGAPLIDGAIGYVECRIVYAHPGGDHTIYVGEIESAGTADGEPLVYFRGVYRGVS